MYQSIRTGKSEKYPKIRKVTKDRKSDQSSERLPKIRTIPKIGKVTRDQTGYQR